MGYKKLEIWGQAHVPGFAVHAMTLNDLPKSELYKVGRQICRSAKSVAACLALRVARRATRIAGFIIFAL